MSSVFPSYRRHYLPAFTARALAALPDKAWAPVMVATGAIEQHGPHLPVAVDSLLGQVWLQEIFAHLPPGINAYVAPPITVGKSNEHVGFPGTLMISKETLRAQLLALATQIKAWGFRHLIILNTHGGNSAVLAYTLREIRQQLGLKAAQLRADVKLELTAQEALYGFHANEVETALLRAVAPELTHPERAVCWYPARVDDPGELRPECAPATYSWASQDISPSGIMGDAPAGTPEKGERWKAQIRDGFLAHLSLLVKAAKAEAK